MTEPSSRAFLHGRQSFSFGLLSFAWFLLGFFFALLLFFLFLLLFGLFLFIYFFFPWVSFCLLSRVTAGALTNRHARILSVASVLPFMVSHSGQLVANFSLQTVVRQKF